MSAPDTAVDEAARARGKRVGLALVLGSAILFSAKAIFVKLSYPYGVDALTLLALRMGMALPVFAALAAVEEHRARAAGNTATARTYGVVAVLGAVGYWLASYLDFAGLAYVTASLERVVLFAYPTFTALLERALFGKKLGRAALVALLLSYAGILLALGGEARVAGANTAIGAGLVLASAAAYACFLVGSGRVVGRYGATRLVAHAMTAACVVVLAHFALSHPLAALAQPPAVLGYAALTAVLSTVLPTVLLGHGIRRLGASQAAIAGSVGPVSTLALGAIFLGERITGPQVAGSALVLVGVTWLSVARRLARRWLPLRGSPVTPSRYVSFLHFPCRGAAPKAPAGLCPAPRQGGGGASPASPAPTSPLDPLDPLDPPYPARTLAVGFVLIALRDAGTLLRLTPARIGGLKGSTWDSRCRARSYAFRTTRPGS